MLAGRLKRAWTSLAVYEWTERWCSWRTEIVLQLFFCEILNAWKPQSSFVFHDGTTVLILGFFVHISVRMSQAFCSVQTCLCTAEKDHWPPVTLPLFRVSKQVWKKMHLLQVLKRLRIQLKMASQSMIIHFTLYVTVDWLSCHICGCDKFTCRVRWC